MEMEMEMHSMSSMGKNKSRRRFDCEQIKLLETMFETEARPELRMKQQLANKLGLHPRQIAIWFQNKRARSKSKQIERDYRILKMSYDNLASKVESLKKEKQSLLTQLQRLQKMTEQSSDKVCQNKEHVTENDDGPNFLAYEHEYGIPLCSDENDKAEYLEDEAEVLNMAHMADDGSLSSVENGYNFETIELLDWQYQL